MSWDKKIPFEKSTGNMLNYVDTYLTVRDSIIWKSNYVFNAELKIVDYYKGRSAVNIILKDTTFGIQYHMFISDFINMVKNRTIKSGKIQGCWTFRKQGQNFGVYLLDDVEI